MKRTAGIASGHDPGAGDTIFGGADRFCFPGFIIQKNIAGDLCCLAQHGAGLGFLQACELSVHQRQRSNPESFDSLRQHGHMFMRRIQRHVQGLGTVDVLVHH